eukprot:CAMPEP_0178457456 /NCGR_PEP_ID=MMETSP0689_2-20121128/47025_1 /TAXON_ID=160604 /ORGANISM="Amphidinium massartii, Strain CS-259" /LENGTH=434 /DNA_ID=CAMNT_0020083705 /DNA_START=71 /DNA_END=1376 /DNA_ORIENTATION=+
MDVDGQGEGALPFVTRTQAKAQAQGFKADTDEQQRQSLSKFARLDTLVTVVDALNVWDALASLETLAERNSSGMVGNTGVAGEGTDSTEVETPDDRSISQLLLDQIEFANVLLLSKSTMLQDDARLAEIAALLQKLNPGAKVIVPKQKNFQDLPLDAIMNTELFNMEKAQASEDWLKEMAKPAHTPETEEYGVSSVVFHRHDRPFHPQRLKDFLRGFGNYATALASHKDSTGDSAKRAQAEPSLLNGVLRAKGRLWIASSHAHAVNMHSAGRQLELAPSALPYLAAVDQADWDEDDWKQHKELIAEGEWHEDSGYGDRESEAIFIGVKLDKAGILKALEAALLTDSELAGGVEMWKDFEDVFFDGDYFTVQVEEEECEEEGEDEEEEDEEMEEDECEAADGDDATALEPPRKVAKGAMIRVAGIESENVTAQLT